MRSTAFTVAAVAALTVTTLVTTATTAVLASPAFHKQRLHQQQQHQQQQRQFTFGIDPAAIVKLSDGTPTDRPSQLIEGKHGVVAAEEATCSQIGVDVLRDGGSASDAAIAAALCVGTLNSFSAGIGGGGFMLVRPSPRTHPNSDPVTIDYRETAPGAATKDMYYGNITKAQRGGLSIAVPGEIRGYAEAHKQFGKVSWARLFEPSIKLATEGFPCSPLMRTRLVAKTWYIFGNREFEDIFAPSGKIVEEGDTIYRKAYGETLRRIAMQGPDVFYTGSVAKHIVSKVQSVGGILTTEDMARYKAVVRPATIGSYRGMKIITTPPPTSGPILLNMLNILEGFPLHLNNGMSDGLEEHLLVEAFKHGNAQRTRLADPAFVDITTNVNRIQSKMFAGQQRTNISFEQTFEHQYYNPEYDIPTSHGTTHVSVVTADGDAASLMSTVNLSFGSFVMDSVTGVILNDQQDDFSTANSTNGFGYYPSIKNIVVAHKRPLSSSTPLIMVSEPSNSNGSGERIIVAGGSGGSSIMTNVVQVVQRILDHNMPLDTAIDEPRLHHQLLPEYVEVEDKMPKHIKDFLESRGHTLVKYEETGVVHIATRHANGTLHAVSDTRKDSVAAGY
ncbi:gamma-glutamyltranspeptidase [Ramicandelaber brevisporus]|nr:gamma-glutamyltranspeptidase [Ramicandelaber brevisporus]